MLSDFSFSRLVQLIRKQWIENSRWYFFATLALIGLLAIIFCFWVFASNGQYTEDTVYMLYMAGLFIGGSIYASISFSALGDKAKAAYWLHFPASHLEKLLCAILYSVIFYVVVYSACFFLVKTVAVAYVQDLVSDDPLTYKYHLIRNEEEFWRVYKVFAYAFFAVQAFYLLGSVYFPRYAFIITSIIGAAMGFVFIMYMVNLQRSFFPSYPGDYSWSGFFVDKQQWEEGSFVTHRYELSSFWKNFLEYTLKFVWAPVFWVVAWFKLKEKQVA